MINREQYKDLMKFHEIKEQLKDENYRKEFVGKNKKNRDVNKHGASAQIDKKLV